MIAAPAWLLDLTRAIARLDRGPLTGIDRVELAYLRYLLARPEPMFALVRTGLGFVLLGRTGAQGILGRMTGQVPLGRADLLGLLTQRHVPQRVQAEADARRLSIARCLPMRLGTMLRSALPKGTVYVNVGHANLTERVIRAVKSMPEARMVVMVHDTIPLEYPQFCRAGVPADFSRKVGLVSANADLVVHTADCTRAVTEVHFGKAGRVPAGVTAPLGVEIVPPDAQDVGDLKRPYYVALGTIEPRKNIGFLLQVWAELQKATPPAPHLYIVGNRGWAAPAVFDQLDAVAASGAITLLHRYDDASVAALLQGAEALLFPSLAEGYGLPPIEAAALGVPVMSSKLPVVEETLGDYPVYLDTSDVYAWVAAINHQMRHWKQTPDAQRQIRVPPSWVDHFDRVFGKV